jgi:3-oxoacyl-[acyl-carrier protein] reductase
MIADGWGRIVNQTSVGAYMGLPSLYGTTKLALVGLTQGLAKELGPHGITVNSIAPGTIHTEATMTVVPEQLRRAQLSRQAIPKEGMPEDLVGTLLYLVGEGSAWVTAQTIFVDGGAVPRV